MNDYHLRAWVLRGMAELIDGLGGDPEAYARRFHLPLLDTGDGKATISGAAVLALMETVAEELACPDFGIRTGLAQGPSAIGPVMVAAMNCATVGEAFTSGLRYLNGLFSAFQIDVVETDEVLRTSYRILLPDTQRTQQFQEWHLAIAVRVLPLLAGPEARLGGVHFSHGPLLDLAHYEAVFGCPVRFRAGGYGVDYRAEDMQRTISTSNAELHAVVSDYLDEIIAAAGLGVEHQIVALIRELLPTGNCNLLAVAQLTFASVRTTQRRLAARGLTFEALVDDARRELALEYLSNPGMNIAQVAGLLGYAEPSAFSNAFRRWTGTSPRAWRAARTRVS
ncbi:AraC family transcriptional regulator [Nocardioides carbamazepini]|uniref:AraC family transcriptional regulator n=1 Tax=Nocardioides carbamazepini TaxID=2854259 RepID=UPI002149E20E|nr:AraC family transcriptional regulator [Nocardioides carbamazepini]MCR1783206.1 AraC family transcriptional regulator [Nocardioides carbamazepini]